jgi:hypothetical protein
MKTTFKKFWALRRKNRQAAQARPSRRSVSLGVECLEAREVLSAMPASQVISQGGWNQVSQMITSPDGLHHAFIGTLNGQSIVIEDGQATGGWWKAISSLEFSPAGNHLAFIGTINNQSTVVEDGKAVGGWWQAISNLQFNSTGTTLSFVGTSNRSQNPIVISLS